MSEREWRPTRLQKCKIRNIQFGEISINIEQDEIDFPRRDNKLGFAFPTISQVGKCLWPASFLLADYFLQPLIADSLEDKRVLELGCGPGMVGVAMSFTGAKCVLTDMADVIPLTQRNVDANIPTSTLGEQNAESKSQGDIGDEIHRVKHVPLVLPYYWAVDNSAYLKLPAEIRDEAFDYIVASDVVYEQSMLPALAHTIRRHCTEHTRVFVSYKDRRLGEEIFIHILEEVGLIARKVPKEEMSQKYQNEHTLGKLSILEAHLM